MFGRICCLYWELVGDPQERQGCREYPASFRAGGGCRQRGAAAGASNLRRRPLRALCLSINRLPVPLASIHSFARRERGESAVASTWACAPALRARPLDRCQPSDLRRRPSSMRVAILVLAVLCASLQVRWHTDVVRSTPCRCSTGSHIACTGRNTRGRGPRRLAPALPHRPPRAAPAPAVLPVRDSPTSPPPSCPPAGRCRRDWQRRVPGARTPPGAGLQGGRQARPVFAVPRRAHLRHLSPERGQAWVLRDRPGRLQALPRPVVQDLQQSRRHVPHLVRCGGRRAGRCVWVCKSMPPPPPLARPS